MNFSSLLDFFSRIYCLFLSLRYVCRRSISSIPPRFFFFLSLFVFVLFRLYTHTTLSLSRFLCTYHDLFYVVDSVGSI